MAAQDVELAFPIAGVNKGFAHNRSNPQTAPDAVNVLPYDGADHRFRGGSRPGFVHLSGFSMSGPPVFMVSFAPTVEDGRRFRQSFVAGTASDVYVNLPSEEEVDGIIAYKEEFVSLAGELLTEADSESIPPVRYLQPDGASVYYAQDESGIFIAVAEVVEAGVEALLTEDGEPLLAAEFSFEGHRSLATPFQGSVIVPGSGNVILEGAGRLKDGAFVADGIEDWSGRGVRAMDHIIELSPSEKWPESPIVPASYTIRFDMNEKLTVASGGNGGRCNFRIIDGPKMISAVSRSVRPLESHIGNVPVGAELVTTYLDRLVFVKDRVWYMSRQGDAGDYHYGADAGDRGRAVAGVTSDAGQPGDPIVALASRGNDYLVMFARETTWVMRGDPAGGGTLLNISRTYGCVDPQAWCHGDGGEIYFLSKEGLCVLPDGISARPEPVSAESVPNELRNAGNDNHYVSMAFDLRYRGVWIFITPKSGAPGRHWWYSKLTNSFWPVTFANPDMQPTAAVVHSSSPTTDSAVVIGDKTGSLRVAVPNSRDGLTPVASRIVIGPYLSAESSWKQGLLTRLVAMLGGEDSELTIEVYTGSSQEEAANKAVAGVEPSYTAGVSGLRTALLAPRLRCVSFCLVIRSNSPWGFESLMATLAPAGLART